MFSFLAGLAGNVVLGWVGRRVVEVGGWLTLALGFIAELPPEHQDTLTALLMGQGGGLSIAAYFGLGAYLWSQIMSFRSTVRPHVTTSTKRKLNVPVLTEEQARSMTGYDGPIHTRNR